MSDESQPPGLRLKPRLRTGNEPAVPVPTAAPGGPATESTGGGTGAASGNPVFPAMAPLPAVPAPPPPAASGEKPEETASTELRVRLKPRLGVNLPPALPAAPAEAKSLPAMPVAPSSEITAPPPTVAASPVEPLPLSLPPIGVVPATEKSPVERPVLPPPMAALATEAAAKFKLKPKAPAPVPSETGAPAAPAIAATELPAVATAVPPSPLVAGPVPVDAPPPPVEAPPPAKLSGALHVPHIRAPGEEMPLPKAPLPPKRPRISKSMLIFALAAGAGIVACVALYAWKVYSPSPPPPLRAPSKVAATPAPLPSGQDTNSTTSQPTKDTVASTPASATPAPSGPTPSDTINQIAAAPKQIIDKAKEAVAARRGNEQARIDAMAAGQEAPDKRALDTPPPSRFADRSPAPASAATPVPVPGAGSLIAPGVTATTNALVAAPKASAAFKRFVAEARITGVFQGNPPRALINGRTVRAGEVVDTVLGAVFDSIDPEQKTITFKDRAGVPATRKY